MNCWTSSTLGSWVDRLEKVNQTQSHPVCIPLGFQLYWGTACRTPWYSFPPQGGHIISHLLKGRMYYCCYHSPLYSAAAVPAGTCNKTGAASALPQPPEYGDRAGGVHLQGSKPFTAERCCWWMLILCLWTPHRYVQLSRFPTSDTGHPGGTGDSRSAPLLT